MHTSMPAMAPMITAAMLFTNAQGAVMATRPAKAPLQVMEGSGFPYLAHMKNMADAPPIVPAIIVLVATTESL